MIGTSVALSRDYPTEVDTNALTFELQFADVDKSVYSLAGLTAPEEFTLTIQHSVDTKGNKRHLVRLDWTKADAFGVPATLSVYENIVVPNSSAFSIGDIINTVNRLVDFFIEGGAGDRVTRIVNGER
jgi:hypothetical protein